MCALRIHHLLRSVAESRPAQANGSICIANALVVVLTQDIIHSGRFFRSGASIYSCSLHNKNPQQVVHVRVRGLSHSCLLLLLSSH